MSSSSCGGYSTLFWGLPRTSEHPSYPQKQFSKTIIQPQKGTRGFFFLKRHLFMFQLTNIHWSDPDCLFSKANTQNVKLLLAPYPWMHSSWSDPRSLKSVPQHHWDYLLPIDGIRNSIPLEDKSGWQPQKALHTTTVCCRVYFLQRSQSTDSVSFTGSSQ